MSKDTREKLIALSNTIFIAVEGSAAIGISDIIQEGIKLIDEQQFEIEKLKKERTEITAGIDEHKAMMNKSDNQVKADAIREAVDACWPECEMTTDSVKFMRRLDKHANKVERGE